MGRHCQKSLSHNNKLTDFLRMISKEGSSLKERQKECKRIDGEIKKSCEDRNKGDKGYIGR